MKECGLVFYIRFLNSGSVNKWRYINEWWFSLQITYLDRGVSNSCGQGGGKVQETEI